MVAVSYSGWIVGNDGKLSSTPYDSNVGRDPLKMALGSGTVIKGWEEGMVGMKRGAKRIIAVPPQLAYGATGRSPVPPNATIILEVSSFPHPFHDSLLFSHYTIFYRKNSRLS